MHENYDDQEDYDDDDFNYDHPSLNPYQWFYKFDIGADTPLSDWLSDIINNITNIPGFQPIKFPVNSWNPNAGGNSLQYLGSNYQGSPIWKSKYFVVDRIFQEYKLHIQSHSKHFMQQPVYYKGLYEILN